MLRIGPWNRLPLTIRWLAVEFQREFLVRMERFRIFFLNLITYLYIYTQTRYVEWFTKAIENTYY